MSTDHVYFDGRVMWAKVHSPDKEYKNYSLDFYPDDVEAVRDTLTEQGSSLTEKEARHEDAPGPVFFKFRREESRMFGDQQVTFGPPLVVQADGETPEKRLVGNGSHVTIKVEFFGEGDRRGHRLLAVRVNDLVEYTPEGPREVKHLPF
jgi:hypothetical protein